MATPSSLPPLDACGFVRVPAAQALWMTCDRCKKSDHFWLAEGRIRCRCGASYDHAIRPDGSTVPLEQLSLVPFSQGPMQLADLEWDPRRLALVALIGLLVLGGVGWALFGG